MVPDRSAVRARFPALSSGFAYMENAGGSQVPDSVIEAVATYLRESYVQTGAGYPQSVSATRTVAEAHAWVEELMGAGTAGKVVLGSSSTVLVHLLAQACGEVWVPGDEVVVAVSNHEANAGPWHRLARRGITVREWALDPRDLQLKAEDLAGLLGPRTRMVAFPHVSNLLGQVADLGAIVETVHAAGAQVCVDGVAYAPHRRMEVERWGVDWYFFSPYKVFGPHMGALFGRHSAFEPLTGPNHFFIPKDAIPYKFELGGPSHEGCAALLGQREYLRWLGGGGGVEAAFAAIGAMEAEPHRALMERLRGSRHVRLVGQSPGVPSVPTVSFLHDGLSSAEIAAIADATDQIGIRHGSMYSVRLCEALGIAPTDGVVRVSLVHTNTVEEVGRLAEVLAPCLG